MKLMSDSEASDVKEPVRGHGKQRISSSRKRVIDETLLSPEETDKLQSRRAYNRDCATRARKRTKDLVSQLQDSIKDLQRDKADLRQKNATMKAQLDSAIQQNQALVFQQALRERQAAFAYGSLPNASRYLQPPMNFDDNLARILASSQGHNLPKP